MSESTEMPNGFARIDRDGHRADVVIQREDKRNAMNEPLIHDLREAFERIDPDDCRAVTLLGEGPVLSAGMDLEMMRDRSDPADRPTPETDPFNRLLETIDDCPVPTVAGIHGAAPAGAFELTLPFDVRLLGADARYGILEVKLGTFPHGGATQRLPRLVGLGKAKKFVLTGEFVDPEEARECGLVAEVVEPGDVKSRTREFADDLAANAPIGMRLAKRALDAALELPLDEGLAYERRLGQETYRTRDYREGFEARLDDREPDFEDR